MSFSFLGVTRLCATTPMQEDICKEENDAHACFCTSDLCNGGSKVRVTFATAAILLFGAIYTMLF